MDKFIYKKSQNITALSATMSDFKYKKHAHEEYAIGVTKRGIQEYNLSGSLQKSFPHGVMIFNPEEIHDGRAHDKELDYYMLYINRHDLLEAAGQKELVRFDKPVVYNQILQNSVVKLSQAILNSQDQNLVNDLFIDLVYRLGAYSTTAIKSDSALLSQAKMLIHDSLNTVINIEDIGDVLGLSKYQFIRFFKHGTGITPYQYFLNAKVSHAKYLLEKKVDIYTIVLECGFVDLTHLNKNFKKTYGLTAFEYQTLI